MDSREAVFNPGFHGIQGICKWKITKIYHFCGHAYWFLCKKYVILDNKCTTDKENFVCFIEYTFISSYYAGKSQKSQTVLSGISSIVVFLGAILYFFSWIRSHKPNDNNIICRQWHYSVTWKDSVSITKPKLLSVIFELQIQHLVCINYNSESEYRTTGRPND